MKKLRMILIGFAAISWLIFLLLMVNHISNEHMIRNFEDGEYSLNAFGALGVLEPYVAPYNEGNVYFEKKNYEKAIACYEKALSKNPSEPMDCEIRINMALAMTLPIKPEEVNDSNRKAVIQTLDDAIEILCENSCADHENKSGKKISGHSKTATELKEDIERFKEELQKEEDPSNPEEDPSNPEEKQPEEQQQTEEEKQREQNIADQLKEIQERGQQERTADQSNPYSIEFVPFSGKSW